MMKKYLVLLLALLMLLPGVMIAAQEDVVTARVTEFASTLPQGYGVIRVDDLNVILAERTPILLDVREVAEYEAGHVEGSFNVPIRTLGQNLALLPDLDAEIIVICKGGARAMLAQTSLRILGYENAFVLAGGFDAWAGAELPVTTDAFVPEAGEAPAIAPELLAAVDTFLSTLPEGYGLVSSQNLSVELVENAPILIDVRSEEEWGTGYIEGAQHIWINEFIARQDEWPEDRDANIVIYCASGYRGGIATVVMELLGYTNVRNLSGGSNAWVAAGLPLAGVPEAAEFSLETTFTSYLSGLPETFNAVRPGDLKTELDGGAELLLVDVRPADEYAEGYIEGAINIPLQELTQHLDMLPNLDAEIVIYCGSGHRSALAMTSLNLLGYTEARSLLTGVGGWTANEFPLVQTPVEYEAGTAPEFDTELFAAVDSFITQIPAGYYVVRSADLNVELADNPPTLIDVRTEGEWTAGYIEGAVHIPLADFMARLGDLPQDKATAIVVYDNPTHRSSMALVMMRMLGYENVRALGGGTGAWTSAELPLVTE